MEEEDLHQMEEEEDLHQVEEEGDLHQGEEEGDPHQEEEEEGLGRHHHLEVQVVQAVSAAVLVTM